MELKRTPLYETHVRLGGRIVEFGGFEMPVQYRDRARPVCPPIESWLQVLEFKAHKLNFKLFGQHTDGRRDLRP